MDVERPAQRPRTAPSHEYAIKLADSACLMTHCWYEQQTWRVVGSREMLPVRYIPVSLPGCAAARDSPSKSITHSITTTIFQDEAPVQSVGKAKSGDPFFVVLMVI